MTIQPPDRTALNKARDDVARARLAGAQLLASVHAGTANLDRLQRTVDLNDRRITAARAKLEGLVNDLKGARKQELVARANFLAALSAWLPSSPADEFQRLSAEYPIALLPVRIETRFDLSGNSPHLKVRVYPDEIFADLHDEELTEREFEDGQSYWEAREGRLEDSPPTHDQKEAREQKGWREMLKRYSSQRAAWIVHKTTPTNLNEPGPLDFPNVERRPGVWNRAAEAYLLPDRWLALAFRDGREVYRAVSNPVRDPLALTHDPQVDFDDPDQNVKVCDEEGLIVDEGVAWTLDYARAIEAGMAVTILLQQPDDLERGFDQLIVLGVKSSLPPEESRAKLEKLLNAHHYARGLAFVRQGTPTNNTAAGPSGFPPEDPDGKSSFAVERGAALNADEGDGGLFTAALGVDSKIVEHLSGADRSEQRNARAMNDALWPATFGYYLEQMMSPVFGAETIRNVRSHFIDNVRGRGSLPAFRVGSTPYGLLPVTSLTRWQPRTSAKICGIVTAFNASGSFTLGGVNFTIPPGTLVVGQELIAPGANLCLDGVFDAAGRLTSQSVVSANTSGTMTVCGVVRTFTAATKTTEGSISIGDATFAIAANVKIANQGLIDTGANLCLNAHLDSHRRIIDPSSVSFNPGSAVTGVDFQLPPLLQTLRGVWARHIPDAPHIRRTDDPDADLFNVLAMDASAQQVWAWDVYGWDFQSVLFGLLFIDWTGWFPEQQTIAKNVMERLGHPELKPRVIWTVLNHLLRLHLPFVASNLSEENGLEKTFGENHDKVRKNYIELILNEEDHEVLKDESRLLAGAARPAALLYFLLRHAALNEYAHVGFNTLVLFGILFEDERVQPELVKVVPGTQGRNTVWQNFDRGFPDPEGDVSLGGFLLDRNNPAPETDPIKSYRKSLSDLAQLPTAELDRLVAETLDVCSHRLDAWITSLANKRLKEMRGTRPTGVHIGAFGWVEELRPGPPGREVKLPDGTTAQAQINSQGYIHAPSMNHAAAAAVMRNAHQSRSGEQSERYAINLSSERVRAALQLLDAVRQGQPLGAALGYSFERGLHESHRPLELDKYIEPFRKLYPIQAGKSDQPGETAEAIAARDVVDGMALRTAWNNGKVPLGSIGRPGGRINSSGLPVDGPDLIAIEEELRRLNDAVDAVADLLTAESVYQLIRGNTETAAASLETIAKGARPPDPQIVRAQRGGTSLTHRFAVVLGREIIALDDCPSPENTPRAQAEKFLNSWAGGLLGNPAKTQCRVSYSDPTPDDPARRADLTVTLADLNIQPLDLLALSLDVNRTAQDSELDRRIAYHVSDKAGRQVEDLRITYALDPATDKKSVKSFFEILELAQAINALVGGARPLRPADLLHPQDSGKASQADLLTGVAFDRLKIARGMNESEGLRKAIKDLMEAAAPFKDPSMGMPQVSALREALVQASLFGVAGAYPATRHGDSEDLRKQLGAQALSVLGELEERAGLADNAIKQVEDAMEADAPPEKRLTDPQKIAKIEEAIRAIFGREFVFLPEFAPVNPDELEQGFNVVLPGDRGNVIRKWFQSASRVRAPLGRWRKLSLYADALGDYPQTLEGGVERFAVAQLPHAENESWVALKFMDEKDRPPSGRVSIALYRHVNPATDGAWAGLLLDEWNEVIPNPKEMTAFAFHYNDTGAEAPQAVLLAAPPTDAMTWDLDTLIDILRETLEMAKLRAIDSRLLPEMNQILPAIYLTTNAANDAISTDLSSMKITPNLTAS